MGTDQESFKIPINVSPRTRASSCATPRQPTIYYLSLTEAFSKKTLLEEKTVIVELDESQP